MRRRAFIRASATTTGGLMLAFHLPALGKAEPSRSHDDSGAEVNAWLAINADDTITIRVAQSEMGQGVMTALPMIVAEELEVDWRKVRSEYADINRHMSVGGLYRQMATERSSAVRQGRPYLQRAGAEARERLIAAAAQRWGVAAESCHADYGRVHHRPSGQSINYGAIAADAAFVRVRDINIKSPDDFNLLGLPTKQLDAPAKVTGEAIYGMDVRLPGMVYAAVAHSPVIGGEVRSLRFNAIREMPGVIQAVRMQRAVAIVAEHFWQAKKAIDALPIQWRNFEYDRLYTADLTKSFSDTLETEGRVIENRGEVAATMDDAEKTIESDYAVPYLAHAALEPMNCTVHLQPARADVWAGLQDPEGAHRLVMALTGLASDQVFIHNCYLGGGFGRRSHLDFVEEAVEIAKEANRPVQMIWTREEDMRAGRYRPMAAIRFKAAFDLDRNWIAYSNHSVTHSIAADADPGRRESDIDPASVEGLADMPYRVENRRITHTRLNTHLTSWRWRSAGHSQNAFAMECFVDEMAFTADLDPIDFRRRYLRHRQDLLDVLDSLEEVSDWRRGLPRGSARGMAIHESFGTICAQAAEVTVTQGGSLKVNRIVSVVDCGNLVNRLAAEQQVESGIVFGLSAALYGKLSIDRGRVLEDNLDTYRLVAMEDMPVIETHFALRGGDHWGGLGEPSTPPVAPAVCNALFKITGRRIRSLPLKDYILSAS